ncbi:hypothetical protein ACS0TY_025843 [Phlomoides rotata]
MGIIPDSGDIKCALCDEEDETSIHLAVRCRIVQSIWAMIYNWLDIEMVPHHDPRINLLQHGEILGQGKKRRIASTIWICTSWAIWNCRNNATFGGEKPNSNKMFGEIKARSWNWVTTKLKEMRGSTYTDWNNNIRRCCGIRC